MRRDPVTLCVVGCGVQAEQAYLPVLSTLGQFSVQSLIDTDLDRCRTLAKRFGIPHYAGSLGEVPDSVEAAVVCLPHHLHQWASCQLLQKGIHVFCEKPMAVSTRDAQAMIQCAEEHHASLVIGNIFRFYWTSQRIKQEIESKALGDITSFEIEDGKLFEWPTSSGFFYDKRQAGGGVLIDTGAHILDLLLWWLGRYPTRVEYWDDDFGGVEGECLLSLDFGPSCSGTVKFSRLAKLNNHVRLTFTHGTLTFRPYDPSGVSHVMTVVETDGTRTLTAPRNYSYADYFTQQLESFWLTLRRGQPSPCSGESILPSIQLIEDCYQHAKRLDLPWLSRPPSPSGLKVGQRRTETHQRRVLVTGSSGFIGGRVAERLYFEHDTPPRCLVRNFHKLTRISRFPREVVTGDVRDAQAMNEAAAGCDVIVHCAYGNTPDDRINEQINVQGTEHLLQAAVTNHVKRFIYLSSIEVYGQAQPPFVDENTRIADTNHSYGRSKWEAEQLCLRYGKEHGLPVVILRPTVVYGPHDPLWTLGVVNRLLNRGFCQSSLFDGLCNPVYVDDCLEAIFLVMTLDRAVGEVFIVGSGETVSWNAYFETYNDILGLPPLPRASAAELRLYWLVRKLFDLGYNRVRSRHEQTVVHTYNRLRERKHIPNVKAFLLRGSLLEAVDVFRRRTSYSIDKACRELGFQPQYPFSRGMTLVGQWLDHISQTTRFV